MALTLTLALRRIISGGQTGVDRGGWDAAIKLGIPWGGWVPRGRRAEDGTIPAAPYLASPLVMEACSSSYDERTRRNVVAGDATLLITRGSVTSPGSVFTRDHAAALGKPVFHVDLLQRPTARPHLSARTRIDDPSWELQVYWWLRDGGYETLNVAGTRESRAPGIQAQTCSLLVLALAWKERAQPEEG